MVKQKKKRYYNAGDIIWSIDLKKEVEVVSVDTEKLQITVLERQNEFEFEHTFPLWRVDVLKYKRKQEVVEEIKKKEDALYFAKVKEDARIPSKAKDEDAGYDVWVHAEPTIVDGKEVREILLHHLQPNIVPTGIATSVNKKFYLNFANERGSTGKHGMLLLSGIVDSGYRGEVFLNIVPLYKDVLITSEVEDVEVGENVILYPYSKAVAQMIDYRVGESHPMEISFEELQAIPSERGTGKMGSSGQ